MRAKGEPSSWGSPPAATGGARRHPANECGRMEVAPEGPPRSGVTWAVLRDLEAQYGDALFILDVDGFTRNYREFLEAFRSIYGNTNIAYSYKTNYIPRLCECVRACGGYAEVVSGMEYDLALRARVPPERIIFNGPYKGQHDIERALTAGATVNIDSADEARLVEVLARRWPAHTFSLGVRCNLDLGAGAPSRFGLDVESDEFSAVFTALGRLKNCRIDGLHCHFSTSQRSTESFARRARGLLELSARYFQIRPPRFLNVGGGFFSQLPPMLQNQFDVEVPTYRQYADAIATQFAREPFDRFSPELIVEPGAALAADVLWFAAKIIHIKAARSRTVALASGSVHNIKPTLHDKNLPMHVLSNESQARPRVPGPIDIVGYTCMEHDCLYRGYPGSLAADDYVLFENVGAYTIVMKPPFIRPSPAIVSCDVRANNVELIRRPETFEDVFATYSFA